jgi:hypothetical protein
MKIDINAEFRIADQKGRITLGSKWAGKRFAVHEEPNGSTILTPVVLIPYGEPILTTEYLQTTISALEALQDNWDGRGSPAPAHQIIARTREVLALLSAGALAHGLHWASPHISSNERGEVTLEWWQDNRSLTLFIRDENQVDFLKAWGYHIEDDMEDGELQTLADFIALARWLYKGEAL